VNRLGSLNKPVLLANGDKDIVSAAHASCVMAQTLPNAELAVYPGSGHGFLFQFPDAFGREVVQFLRDWRF
jgi:pimeloyl-ACP methyl ester carboxylesterase